MGSYVDKVWDGISEKDANNTLLKLVGKGMGDVDIEDMYIKRYSSTFSVLEDDIRKRLIDLDRGAHLPGELSIKETELDDAIQKYKEEGGANYDVLWDVKNNR